MPRPQCPHCSLGGDWFYHGKCISCKKDPSIIKVQSGSNDEILYKIIDDIDTALDMFKPEMQGFEKYVVKKIKEAQKIIHSPDGLCLVYTDPCYFKNH